MRNFTNKTPNTYHLLLFKFRVTWERQAQVYPKLLELSSKEINQSLFNY